MVLLVVGQKFRLLSLRKSAAQESFLIAVKRRSQRGRLKPSVSVSELGRLRILEGDQNTEITIISI